MTLSERLEAASAMLTIVALKTRKLADLPPEEQATCGAALAHQIEDLASEIKKIAENSYVKAGVLRSLALD